MKIIKFTALALMLVISFTALVGCDDLKMLYYRAEMYSYVNKNINPEFESDNRIQITYQSNDPEKENVPESRKYIINDAETFNTVFSEPPFEVNFKRETVFLCAFNSCDIRNYFLRDVSVEDGVAKIYIEKDNSRDVPDSDLPYQRWMAVKMRKSDASEVRFIEHYFSYYDGNQTRDL